MTCVNLSNNYSRNVGKEKEERENASAREETAIFNDWGKWKEACTLVKKQHGIFSAQSESERQLAEWESVGYETRDSTKLLPHFLALRPHASH